MYYTTKHLTIQGLLQFIIPLFFLLVKSNRLKLAYIFINDKILFLPLLTTVTKKCIILYGKIIKQGGKIYVL